MAAPGGCVPPESHRAVLAAAALGKASPGERIETGEVDGSPVSGWQHPPSFYCPISRRCMHDPVVLSDGHTYERRHIERWLRHHNTSPVSGLQLPQKEVFPNHALRNAIEEYFQQVFSAHRRAIRTSISATEAHRLGSNAPLLRTIDALMQCSLLVNADLSTERVLRRIMDEAKLLVGAEVASVFLVDAVREELYSTVNSTGEELRIPVTAGIAGHVATSGEPVIVHDAYGDARFSKMVDVKTGFKTRNMMCVPLKARKGGIIGVVQLLNKAQASLLPAGGAQRGPAAAGEGGEAGAEEGFTLDDLQFLQVFASQAATAIASSAALDEQPLALPPGNSKDCWRRARGLLRSLLPFRTGARPGLAKAGLVEEVEVLREDELDNLAKDEAARPTSPSSCPEIAKKVSDTLHTGTVQIGKPHNGRVKALLEEALENWQFDAAALAEATDNRPLSTLGGYLFRQLGLVAHFQLDQEKLTRFFDEIERGYAGGQCYHNGAHAANVLHAMHALLQHGGLAPLGAAALGAGPGSGSEQLARMACLLAAAIHDYEHRGLTNDFLVKTVDEWAVRYNDKHVNEQHHVAAAFAVLRRPECNFLAALPQSDFRRLRSLVIDLVIATDMSSNGNILQTFTQALDAAGVPAPGPGPGEEGGERPRAFAPGAAAEAVLTLQVATKCADLGHLALGWEAHVQWVRRLEEEFYAQGDQEKALGLPVSFLMDRGAPGASATQVGFFEAIVLPLFRTLARALPEASPMLRNVLANYRRWQELQPPKKGATAAVGGA